MWIPRAVELWVSICPVAAPGSLSVPVMAPGHRSPKFRYPHRFLVQSYTNTYAHTPGLGSLGPEYPTLPWPCPLTHTHIPTPRPLYTLHYGSVLIFASVHPHFTQPNLPQVLAAYRRVPCNPWYHPSFSHSVSLTPVSVPQTLGKPTHSQDKS